MPRSGPRTDASAPVTGRRTDRRPDQAWAGFAKALISCRPDFCSNAEAGERNPDLLCEGALKKLREIIQVAPTRRCRATGRGWPPPPFLEGSVQGTH
jgi:hypothetical protein